MAAIERAPEDVVDRRQPLQIHRERVSWRPMSDRTPERDAPSTRLRWLPAALLIVALLVHLPTLGAPHRRPPSVSSDADGLHRADLPRGRHRPPPPEAPDPGGTVGGPVRVPGLPGGRGGRHGCRRPRGHRASVDRSRVVPAGCRPPVAVGPPPGRLARSDRRRWRSSCSRRSGSRGDGRPSSSTRPSRPASASR